MSSFYKNSLYGKANDKRQNDEAERDNREGMHFKTRNVGQLQTNMYNLFGRPSAAEYFSGTAFSDSIGEPEYRYGQKYANQHQLMNARALKMVSRSDMDDY